MDIDPDLVAAFTTEFANRPVVAVGAGVSKWSAGAPLWNELLLSGVEHAEGGVATLPGNQTRQLLDCADEVKRVLISQGKYSDWLTAVFGGLETTDHRLIDALYGLESAILTTNYDRLLTRGRPADPIGPNVDQRELVKWMQRSDSESVLHLHGYYTEPDLVVFARADYAKLKQYSQTEFVRKAAAGLRGLVFIGFGAGLADPSLLRLLDWARSFDGGRRHYRLGREEDVALWRTLRGVKNVIYGETYDDLPGYLDELARQAQRKRAILPRPVNRSTKPLPWTDINFGHPVTAIAFSNDGTMLAASGGRGGEGSHLGVWSIVGDDVAQVDTGDDRLWVSGECYAVAFSQDCAHLAVGGVAGGSVYAVDGWTRIGGANGYIHTIEFRDNSSVLIGDRLRDISELDRAGLLMREDDELITLAGGIGIPASLVVGAAFGDRGRDLATRALKQVRLWMLPDDPEGRPVIIWRAFDAEALAWNAEGTRLVTVSGSKVDIQNTENLKHADALERKKYATASGLPLPLRNMALDTWLVFTDNTARLATINSLGTRLVLANKTSAAVVDITSRAGPRDVYRWTLGEEVRAIALSRDGTLLATAGSTRIQLWTIDPNR